MLVAEICANVAAKNLNQTYTYAVPARLNFLTAGWRVIVPFNGQIVDGFVMSVRDTDETFEFELKEISDVVDAEPWFTLEMRLLSQWLADFYLCPLAQSMSLFMPGGHSKKFRPKMERVIRLAGTFDEADFKRFPAQLKILQNLRDRKEIPIAELKNSSALKKLVEKNLITFGERRVLRDSYAKIKSTAQPLSLTAEQSAAVDAVKKSLALKKFQGFLLHGVTGSGKTQVYIELAKITRQMGRRAVILVPEIALTGQIVQKFKAHFEDVLVIHSKLSVAERNDAFYKIRSGEVGIVIGARSALFTPVFDVGLIVLDEEQDNSYKQDRAPFYHARIVAEEFAKFHNAAVVFGSATPSLENYYRAQQGELEYLELAHRALNQPLPEVELVDMRAELRAGNKSVLSGALRNLLEETLANGQQAIILLNRRGFSTFVMCRDCGAVMSCPDCGRTMAYHADGKLHCHTCDIEREAPDICPNCGSERIRYFGTGTQKLDYIFQRELPEARILRMDRDSTGGKFGHEKILEAFRRGECDILLGTQMVAKGHDIQNVTAIGILSADGILFFPDFRAPEQCFDLITQAAGRAGRADLPGRVVVQTYNTEADAIQFACRQDYKGFCAAELPKREFSHFPPYCRLVKLIFASKKAQVAEDFAKLIVAAFKFEVESDSVTRQEIFGPIPALIENLRGVYRFSVLIKSADLGIVRGFLRRHNLHKNPDVQIDFDPLITN